MNDKRYRISVDFREVERDALTELCERDYRQPEDEIRWFVVQEANRRGLLPSLEVSDAFRQEPATLKD